MAALKDLAAAHALGALSAPEAAEIERELSRLDDLAAELASFREVVAHLAASTPPARPPAELKQQVLARVRKETQARLTTRASGMMQAPRAPRASGGMALFGLVLALIIAGIGAYFFYRADTGMAGIRKQANDLQFSRDSLAARLQYREGTLTKILTPGTDLYEMSGAAQGSGSGPAPVVQVIWVKDRTQWLVNASNLSPAPAGKNYQLWYVVNGQNVTANVFNTDQDGHAFFALDVPPEVAKVTQAIITVEPEGGSPQPTAPALLSGAVAR